MPGWALQLCLHCGDGDCQNEMLQHMIGQGFWAVLCWKYPGEPHVIVCRLVTAKIMCLVSIIGFVGWSQIRPDIGCFP